MVYIGHLFNQFYEDTKCVVESLPFKCVVEGNLLEARYLLARPHSNFGPYDSEPPCKIMQSLLAHKPQVKLTQPLLRLEPRLERGDSRPSLMTRGYSR